MRRWELLNWKLLLERVKTSKRFPNCFSRLVVFLFLIFFSHRFYAHLTSCYSFGHMLVKHSNHTHGFSCRLIYDSQTLNFFQISSSFSRKENSSSKWLFIITPSTNSASFFSLRKQQKYKTLLLTFPTFFVYSSASLFTSTTLFWAYHNTGECQKL